MFLLLHLRYAKEIVVHKLISAIQISWLIVFNLHFNRAGLEAYFLVFCDKPEFITWEVLINFSWQSTRWFACWMLQKMMNQKKKKQKKMSHVYLHFQINFEIYINYEHILDDVASWFKPKMLTIHFLFLPFSWSLIVFFLY